MPGYTGEELNEDFETIKIFRQDKDGSIELIASQKENNQFITDTIVLEEYEAEKKQLLN